MNVVTRFIICGFFFLIAFNAVFAQENDKDTLFSDNTFSGLKLRSIGPALMSGRIADIAINPDDPSQWYVAVGSGGVWKTTNAGTTWKPIFDSQPSYSIGCVTMDPENPLVVWVGTGENVGGRHVGYGDGIYRSLDGGATWKNMGLKESHHISKIIVHPEKSDMLWVAAQGPLWSKGGERGLYKTTDGGNNWEKVLGDDEWVGVTDILIDPRNPDILYAATWQRHRNVAAYMGGGPGSGIHSSDDGGTTWKKLTKGLPSSNMGKIGLAISPQNPDVLYAAIELDRRTGAIYRSENRGESWEKRSDAVSGATGPHYYQELYASPHQFDRIYLVDVRMQVSDDGGKNFRRMKEQHKHSDNHALVFRKDDPDYLLVGTDGGLYESFDLAENWRFIENLPVTQFYKLALDDAEPFYNIYGGTQDNNTQGGPSRTTYTSGIHNSDWFITLGGDGHQPATEPGNPDIIYSESQQGFLSRIDLTNGETLSIQPQPEEGEDYERYNWDSPILISPHSPTRIYFASQRLWRSDNRGDSWIAISGDLTHNQERLTLPIMENNWSWDSPWDVSAMSNYNTITSIAESPLLEGLLYVGTDDGLINVTEDDGTTWRKIEVGDLPDVPKTAFVNDIKADLFDVSTVYVALDNHKYGDLDPYLLKSTDRGNSWKSIKGNLPDRNLVWRLVQDHVDPNLLFTATEFGVYFTIDGGAKWIKLTGGVPTISFRDLAIQRRENDLVAATFGRGFYILDDYSVLRDVSVDQLNKEATLFPTRKAWWYIPSSLGVISGASHFTAPNPPYGAVFTYYLKEQIKTLKSIRNEKEKEQIDNNQKVSFPGWDEVEAERRQDAPQIWLTIKDNNGNVIRRIEGKNNKGFSRVAWDLTWPATDAIVTKENINGDFIGARVAPGEYTVTLSKQVDGIVTDLSEPMPFKVERMYKGALDGVDPQITAAFWRETEILNKSATAASKVLEKTLYKVELMQKALSRSLTAPGYLDTELYQLRHDLLALDEKLNGNRSKREAGEKNNPTIASRLNLAAFGTFGSTYGPTETLKRSLQIAGEEFRTVKGELDTIVNDRLPILEKAMIDAGAPWMEGQPIPDY
ncbi:MAG: glycosyl hydrolase [Bacteroidetes bacterium]|nr:glycosyl hydrolase [Bacteroidota bacterium]